MLTKRMLEQARRPDFDVDPLRDAEAALSSMEWVTATHAIPRGEESVARHVIALGRFLVVAISFVLVAAIIAAG